MVWYAIIANRKDMRSRMDIKCCWFLCVGSLCCAAVVGTCQVQSTAIQYVVVGTLWTVVQIIYSSAVMVENRKLFLISIEEICLRISIPGMEALPIYKVREEGTFLSLIIVETSELNAMSS